MHLYPSPAAYTVFFEVFVVQLKSEQLARSV
jgi:hypothetical protein